MHSRKALDHCNADTIERLPELTTMVNNQNPYTSRFPHLQAPAHEDQDSSDRKILGGQLWDLERLREAAQADQGSGNLLVPITRRCATQLDELRTQGFELYRHLLLLRTSDYRGSVWSRGGSRPGKPGPWLPCDEYVLRGVEFTNPSNGYTGVCDYYFKFCESATGLVFLFVSAHVSN